MKKTITLISTMFACMVMLTVPHGNMFIHLLVLSVLLLSDKKYS